MENFRDALDVSLLDAHTVETGQNEALIIKNVLILKIDPIQFIHYVASEQTD